MKTDATRLRQIFDRSSGLCHVCGRRVSFRNYARLGMPGAWEIEHSIARALGGTDRLCNLYPAHISCNRSKQAVSSRTARARHGRRRAPLSKKRRAAAKVENAFAVGLLGFVAGATLGPAVAIIGAALGAGVGHDLDPDEV